MMAPTDHRIRRIIIAGGGTAGWMSAAALGRLCSDGLTEVTLIESDSIGTIGVGEATIPPLVGFNQLIGIDEADFIADCNATFKLGIEFDGWSRPNERYMHPFGVYGRDIEAVKFYQIWLKLRSERQIPPLGQFSLSEVAAYKHRFAHPAPDKRSVLSSLAYAYHLDAGLYAKSLRKLSENMGVRRVEGLIEGVTLDNESGHITSLELAGGQSLEADFFIDCTGFKALLISGALGVEFEDWSHWLPCNRALTAPSAALSDPPPFTKASAQSAGWQWRIPLQNRTGNGFVYSSEFMTDDAAQTQFSDALNESATGPIRPIRFTTGLRKKSFEKNCVAIGLSAGFLEPLESTSIHLIQSGITKLMALLPDRRFMPIEAKTYNKLARQQFEQVRDFIILHYRANERVDEPFWDHMRTMPIPESLQDRLDLFRSKGRILRQDDELFDVDNWAAVLLGQNIMPDYWDPMADTLPVADLARHLEGMSTLMDKAAESLPRHSDYIQMLIQKSRGAAAS